MRLSIYLTPVTYTPSADFSTCVKAHAERMPHGLTPLYYESHACRFETIRNRYNTVLAPVVRWYIRVDWAHALIGSMVSMLTATLPLRSASAWRAFKGANGDILISKISLRKYS